jgi:hypothetical protein
MVNVAGRYHVHTCASPLGRDKMLNRERGWVTAQKDRVLVS